MCGPREATVAAAAAVEAAVRAEVLERTAVVVVVADRGEVERRRGSPRVAS